jgi:Glycosyltransferase family 87/WD40-like Beta Propeller Repeat
MTSSTCSTPDLNSAAMPGHRQPGSRMLAIAEWIVLAFLLAIFVVRGFAPAWRTLNTDFPNYYLAASLYRTGIPLDRVYEWTWVQRQKDYLGIEQPLVEFIPNPPLCVLPVLPISALPPLTAKRTWLVLNITLLFVSLELLHRVTHLSRRRCILVALLCVTPLQTNFLVGQYYVLILMLICAAYYVHCKGHRLTSGLLLAVAASLKIFPLCFAIFFAWKRDWRALTSLLSGTAALAVISVVLFGSQVNQVFLIEVLPRALRGDLIGPYSLQWSSFTALWHHLFLFEPELNPLPSVNSPILYAFAQATTSTLLLFGFVSSRSDRSELTKALEWGTFVLVLLLLSSMPSSYHYCVLIFTAIVGINALLRRGEQGNAVALLLLFAIACAPLPPIGGLLSTRLLATTALYVFLLAHLGRSHSVNRNWLTAAFAMMIILTCSTVHVQLNRAEDFDSRISHASLGYGSANPVSMGNLVVYREMVDLGYRAAALTNGEAQYLPWPKDVLSLAGTKGGSIGYFEQVNRQSTVVRVALSTLTTNIETLAEGQEPTISPDGNWVAFVREEKGRSTVWLCAVDCQHPQSVMMNVNGLLEIAVTSQGDLIAAIGGTSSPHFVRVRRATGLIEPMNNIKGPVRYPSISPDGLELAFSRRDGGSWHLTVRSLATGKEQQLTHAACNAVSPSWDGPHTLLYATDCGRGLGLGAIARMALPN